MTAIYFRFLLTILWELLILVWEFLHVKVKYWCIFFVTSFLCSLKFLLFHRIEYPKRCITKYWNFSMTQFVWYDCTFKKWPWPLTYEGNFFSESRTTLYMSCINFRSISLLVAEKWNITYWPDTQIHTHTDTHTDSHTGWKQYLAKLYYVGSTSS